VRLVNTLKVAMLASSLLALACTVELARQVSKMRYALEQLNMRLGLVEALQWRAAHPSTVNGLYKASWAISNTNYTVLESEPRP